MQAQCQEKVKYMCFASRMRLLIRTQTCRSLVNQHHTPCPGIGQIHVNMLGKWPRETLPREVLLHPDKTAVLRTGAKEKQELRWIYYFSEYFHDIRKTPAMIISVSSDILKLIQLENSFVHSTIIRPD